MLTPHTKTKKPPFNYSRPLSHSQLSSFKYSPERWYESYILGIRQTSPEMTFGSMIDKKIQDDPKFLKKEIVRYKHLQYKLETEFEGITLVGLPDALDLKGKKIRDYKTGRQKWDKKRADDTDQLSMYLLMIYLIHGIKPQDFECYIDWMPTHIENGEVSFVEPLKVQTFKTKRSMAQILKFGKSILDTRKKMVNYYENHA